MRNDLAIQPEGRTDLEHAGQVANGAAAIHIFDEYLSRKSQNTIRNQKAALDLFADYLTAAGVRGQSAKQFQQAPEAWRGVTWGIVDGFSKWMLTRGYSMASINNRLSAVKVYCQLAAKAGFIDPQVLIMIKAVSGYRGKEAKHINEKRRAEDLPTRLGPKKSEHVSLSPDQAKILKRNFDPERGQGRRDALLMTLLLDHGLRVSEVASLQVTDFDLEEGELRFYRKKVDITQTHKLTTDALKATLGYFDNDAPSEGRVILGSRRDGKLTDIPMSERAITKRVADLGRDLLGLCREKRIADRKTGEIKTVLVGTLSAHDCRHYWATDAARNRTDAFALRDAGGWSSLAMPSRYVEAASVANEGVKLSLT